MPLENLKRELKEQRKRAVQLEQEKRHAEAARQVDLREYTKGQIPALRCLQSIERHFWECVHDFAGLANLKISHTNRPMFLHLFPIPGLAATLAKPDLYASFECGGWNRNTARLQVSGQDAIWFCAEYERQGHYAQGVAFQHESYVRVSDSLKISAFNPTAARTWLDALFEDYYRKLTAHFNHRAV
jgi:hypothetical protein